MDVKLKASTSSRRPSLRFRVRPQPPPHLPYLGNGQPCVEPGGGTQQTECPQQAVGLNCNLLQFGGKKTCTWIEGSVAPRSEPSLRYQIPLLRHSILQTPTSARCSVNQEKMLGRSRWPGPGKAGGLRPGRRFPHPTSSGAPPSALLLRPQAWGNP